MAALTDFAENKIVDAVMRGQNLTIGAAVATWSAAPIWHVGLIVANRGYWAASSAYVVGDYALPITPNGRLYRCTTAGTSSATQPTWPITDGGTVADGSVVWAEQSIAIEAGTIPEPSGGGYARIASTASLANWSGTQAAGTTVGSTGTDGMVENNAVITYGAPSANWGVVFGMSWFDASSAGNAWFKGALTIPKTINSGDAPPSFAAAALTFQVDN